MLAESALLHGGLAAFFLGSSTRRTLKFDDIRLESSISVDHFIPDYPTPIIIMLDENLL